MTPADRAPDGLGALAAAAVCALLAQSCAPAVTTPASSLESVARAIGHEPDDLRILDERPLVYAYLPGEYSLYDVRELSTGKTLSVALDRATGKRVDPDALRRREYALASSEGRRLGQDLRNLVLLAPEQKDVPVRIRFAGTEPWDGPGTRARFQAKLDRELAAMRIAPIRVSAGAPIAETTLSCREIVSLGRSSLVDEIELRGDVEID